MAAIGGIGEGGWAITAGLSDAKVRVKYHLRATARRPSHCFRIAPAFVANHNADRKRARREHLPTGADCGINDLLRRVELHFVLPSGDCAIGINHAGADLQTVAGHTLGAVAYCVEGSVFTGDTLFVAGCGRLFEGTAEQMHSSLTDELGKLPPKTRVYCGHEYTITNLRFAATVEPENAAVLDALARAEASRERGEPTVPSTIGAELEHNPFMRVSAAAVREWFTRSGAPGDPSSGRDVLAAVRKAKDTCR